ncbi:hypothetical protein NLI96_g11911 [Meripilus lineatus]|uniref:Uncharacterized protein n=1 Tax=Meripilus lineatus TaxID=2056292 RepID=A0AAD5YAE9_9APHY|nr:hypothetical protein NLI96_g11911 [Physisporinus lineatus]
MGDLGTSLKWDSVIPSSFGCDPDLGPSIHQQMKACEKKYGKKKLSDIVSLLNAPRRTAVYDPISSWNALSQSADPLRILSPSASTSIRRLHEARQQVRLEVERCSRGPGTGPKFSGDGKVAMVRIHSAASIHPVIATRWANTLKSSKLKIVMCANDGYLTSEVDFEGELMTNFSCRIAKSALEREEVNIIAMLTEYASRVPGLRDSMGDNFARGHKEASGGIVKTSDFEKLWRVMSDSEEGETLFVLHVLHAYIASASSTRVEESTQTFKTKE